MNSWRWNELEDDALDDLPHDAQILYLRVMRKHMDYRTGITGRVRKISYTQMREVLEYHPPKHSRDKPVTYSKDQLKRLVQKLVDAGLIERMHCTDKGVQPMEVRLPMASCDADEQRHESATATPPRQNPHDYGAGEGNPATRAPHKLDQQRHPSGSGTPSLPKGKESSRKAKSKWGEPIDHELSAEMAAAVSADLDAPVKYSADAWANEFRLMRNRDGRTVEQIRYLITWTAKHEFWSGVVLSPTKLRAKWDQLAKQVKQQHKPKASSGRHAGLQAPSTDGLIDKGDGTYDF